MASCVQRLILALVASLLSFCAAQDGVCDDLQTPGCGTFPPGHDNIGASWLGIGQPPFNATILSFEASLILPLAPLNSGGLLAINPALENTVSAHTGIFRNALQ